MGTGLGVTTKTSNLGEVEAELVYEPVDGVTGAASEDTDEVVAGEVTGLSREGLRGFTRSGWATTHGFLGVRKEDVVVIRDTELLLAAGAGTVDTRGGLGGVSTHETGEGSVGG